MEIDNIKPPKINKEDQKCAPGISFESGSCIDLRILVEMAKAYNEYNKNNEIKLYPNYETLKPNKYKEYLLTQFSERMQGKCKTQECWTHQGFMKHLKEIYREELSKRTFRPDGPEGRFEWLNTLNINDAMEQYESLYPEFKFMGAVPMDFDDLPALGIADFNFEKSVKQGKTKLGFVFNLDESWKDGSHWVALFVDLKKGECFFMDSYGIEPSNPVKKLMKRIVKFFQMSGIKSYRADYNKVRHQYGNSECGVYSMNFILRMLKGESFDDFCKSKTTDKQVNKCRNVYFKNSFIQEKTGGKK